MNTVSMTELTGARDVSAPTIAARAQELARAFAEVADRHDAEERFVADNYARLKEAGLFAAGVPVELGGEGAGIRALCEMVRLIAQGCGSTGLAFAMHTHQVAIPAWRWMHQPQVRPAVEPVLRRVAAGAVLLSSGGSDWVGGAPGATRVDGGYRIDMRKIFVSGAPAGDILVTSAAAGDEVIHFPLPMNAPEVRMLDTWHTLGMRGTASHDVAVEGFFVPDDKVALKRPGGAWHPLFQIVTTYAFPLIYSAYLGVAEAARDAAVALAGEGGKADLRLAGEMETALFAARAAMAAMIATAEENRPGEDSVNRIMMGRRIVEEQAIRTVTLAMELPGGQAFYRDRGLERRFRDVQGARYHPMRREQQYRYAGAMALGQPVTQIY